MKVLLGMSGGVDSSVAAKILMDRGYDVTGATIKMFSAEDISAEPEKCFALSDAEDAGKVAEHLGIKHIVTDFSDEFKRYVMDDFGESYLKGETPNPCLVCNRFIKFGKMLDYAMENGFDLIATGHYARRGFDERTGKYRLFRPSDRSKDQTYVLYGITQYQLSKTIFPLGDFEKADVRKIAAEEGFVNSHKPDSQDICFVPDGNYGGFIEKRFGVKSESGDYLDVRGNIIGQHKGVIYYTVGQRKGLGIAMGRPVYVIDKDAGSNTVTIGDEEMLFKDEINVRDVNLLSGEELDRPFKASVKIRYSRREEMAEIMPIDGRRARIVFEKPQRAPAYGQAAVFYDGDVLLGGGIICRCPDRADRIS